MNRHRCGGGRPRKLDRVGADAIFCVLRTGCQGKALDQTELCPGSTACDRFQEWVQADVVLKLWHAGGEQFGALKGIDWDWLSRDDALTNARLGGKKTGPNPTDRGTDGVTRSLLPEGQGVPIGLAVAAAKRPAKKLVRTTIASIGVQRPEPTAEQPQGLCLDQGSDVQEVRAIVTEFGFTAHLQARGEAAHALKREAGFGARRWGVEGTPRWLNQFRRILVRWEKNPENYAAFLPFACALIAFRAAGLFG